MEHIYEFDWCATKEDRYFVNEKDLDNCVTEKILRNKFCDPLISSDSENEGPHCINWDEVFTRKQGDGDSRQKNINVPGLRSVVPYPKLSSMTIKQHYQCLKVLCATNPKILEAEFIPRPTKQDHKVFEEIKDTYEKEKRQYLEWARQVWANSHCIRALRPKPFVEAVYDAEFKEKAHAIQSFPKYYEMAAQIPLESSGKCDFVLDSELVKVDISKLPKIEVPDMVIRQCNIMSLYATSEPCNKHPCRFVLPREKSMTNLPLTEVNRELAQFAADNDAVCIASESAVKSLLQRKNAWRLPLSVCQTIDKDGESTNVIVLCDAIPPGRQKAQKRTHIGFKHLLHNALIPLSEKCRLLEANDVVDEKINNDDSEIKEHHEDESNLIQPSDLDIKDSSEDEGDNLFIDAVDDFEDNVKEGDTEASPSAAEIVPDKQNNSEPELPSESHNQSIDNNDQISIFSCTCKDTPFGVPPPRSFRKWKIENTKHKEQYNIVIHCPHKTRDDENEVLLEPIVEYQIDLGATKQSEDKMKSLALSLYLRDNAKVLNARVDGLTGDLVTVEPLSLNDVVQQHPTFIEEAGNVLYTFINQLQGLLPGNYVLEHETCHGPNAFLYAAKNTGTELTLQLLFDCTPVAEFDEARGAQVAPELTDQLLPYHKFRKILPCAFTPHPNQVAKEPKKRVTRQKTPPQAIRWPKKKKKKRKKNI